MTMNVISNIFENCSYVGEPPVPVNKNHPAGSIQFANDDDGNCVVMFFICPCGCGTIGGVTMEPTSGWNWNSNQESPTFEQSILVPSCNWQGFLTDGNWHSV